MVLQQKAQFKAALTYIMQYATHQELEIFTEAISRRLHTAVDDRQPENPEHIAKKISYALSQSLNKNMEGMRRSLRKYAADIIVQEAPEVTENEISALLDLWIPSQNHANPMTGQQSCRVRGIPPQALYEMIVQFVSYSIGEMEQTEYQALTASLGNWTTRYWQIFPIPVKHEIKAFLNGTSTSGQFRRTIKTLLFAGEETL